MLNKAKGWITVNKITALRFQKISLRNFRVHTQETFDLGDMTYITGDNFIGKTSILHGICYALFGVTFFGQTDIDSLRKQNENAVEASLTFTDQNGQEHTITRTRKGDKTELALDARSLRQEDISSMLCNKDLFLSMFNPSYLPAMSQQEARAFIEKQLPPVNQPEVLAELSEQEQHCLADLVITDPVLMLKDYRKAIKELETEKTKISGQIDFVKAAKETVHQKITETEAELQRTLEAIDKLTKQQFEGIDRAALQRLLDSQDMDSYQKMQLELHSVSEKLEQRKNQQYASSYQSHLAEYDAQLKMLAAQCKELKAKSEALKPGGQCPVCFNALTAENLSATRTELSRQYQELVQRGNQFVAQKKEILDYEQKEREQFLKFQSEDVEKLSARLKELQEPMDLPSPEQLAEAKRLLQYGNLSDTDMNELCCLKATLPSLRMELDNLRAQDHLQQLKALVEQQSDLDKKSEETQRIMAALSEYIAKRAELSVKPLDMPNVQIKLWEAAKSTGELKSTFQFTYKGRNYGSLSLSEQILAGLELTATLRKLSGIDCPVCVDNKESIGSFGNAVMPSQVIMLQFVKGQKLNVAYRNISENMRKVS